MNSGAELKLKLICERLRLDHNAVFPEKPRRGRKNEKQAQFPIPIRSSRLTALRKKYKRFAGSLCKHSQWTELYIKQEVCARSFRGDRGYIYQLRDLNTDLHFLLTCEYVKSIDTLGLLGKLTEDGAFGAYVVRGRTGEKLSRDLLDSILEIYFLERTLSISCRKRLSILDIGAGYGRFAHRLAEAFPTVRAYCVDAIPESMIIAQKYIKFRRLIGRVKVIPLDECGRCLMTCKIDIAVNIHSFSECPLKAIVSWLDLIARHHIAYLMIVPHAGHVGDMKTGYHGGTKLYSMERNGARLDYFPELIARGFRLLKSDPKYLEPIMQIHGVSPTHHYLFKGP
jgi:SAM-dependent methyltransferase